MKLPSRRFTMSLSLSECEAIGEIAAHHNMPFRHAIMLAVRREVARIEENVERKKGEKT